MTAAFRLSCSVTAHPCLSGPFFMELATYPHIWEGHGVIWGLPHCPKRAIHRPYPWMGVKCHQLHTVLRMHRYLITVGPIRIRVQKSCWVGWRPNDGITWAHTDDTKFFFTQQSTLYLEFSASHYVQCVLRCPHDVKLACNIPTCLYPEGDMEQSTMPCVPCVVRRPRGEKAYPFIGQWPIQGEVIRTSRACGYIAVRSVCSEETKRLGAEQPRASAAK